MTMTATTPRFAPLLNRAYELAVRRLVEALTMTEQEMVRLAHGEDEEIYAWPMWGTLFLVADSCDRRSIEALMVNPMPDGAEDVDALVTWAEEHDIDITAYVDDDPDPKTGDPTYEDADTEELASYLRDEWLESGSEDAELASAGWEDVEGTGLIAREIAGDLYLGIDGCGYSFYGNIETGERDGHWPRLYDAMGYSWEVSGYRADAVVQAARQVSNTHHGSKDETLAVLSLRRAVLYQGAGGPLTQEEIDENETRTGYDRESYEKRR